MKVAKEKVRAFIPSTDSDLLQRYQEILGIHPSETIFFSSRCELDKKRSIADELGYGIGVRAARKIREGSTDSKLFAEHAENWDAEDRCYNALSSVGVDQYDLLEPLKNLNGDDLLKIRLASLNSREKNILIWEDPTDGLSHSGLNTFLDFLKDYPNFVLIKTEDRALLYHVDQIWREIGSELRNYTGNLEDYVRTYNADVRLAAEAVEKAEDELELRQHEANSTYFKRVARRDRARKFADTGLPRKHRGNMKRKSQESLAKVKFIGESKVEEAERHLADAMAEKEKLIGGESGIRTHGRD